MAVLDAGMERSSSLTEWVRCHGAFAALLGCIAFWAVFGTSLYIILTL